MQINHSSQNVKTESKITPNSNKNASNNTIPKLIPKLSPSLEIIKSKSPETFN